MKERAARTIVFFYPAKGEGMRLPSVPLQPKPRLPERKIHRNRRADGAAFGPHQGARRKCRLDGLDKHPGTLLELRHSNWRSNSLAGTVSV
jgi:hypothetical protein